MAQSIDQKSFLSVTQRFLNNFFQLASQKFTNLPQAIIGDFRYKPINQFTYAKKKKIIKYLQSKFLNIVESIQNTKKTSQFTKYDPQIFNRPAQDLQDMKNILLKAYTQIEAAQANFSKLKINQKVLKAQYLNQIAYQFDKQRMCSIGWGLVFGAFICSTIYRKGSISRKAALFLSFGHIFGQTSYRINIDKYIDSVCNIFEEDVKQFQKQLKIEQMKDQQERKLKKTTMIT